MGIIGKEMSLILSHGKISDPCDGRRVLAREFTDSRRHVILNAHGNLIGMATKDNKISFGSVNDPFDL